MKVHVASWHGVAIWQWNVASEDVCGICRVDFDGTCPDCRRPGDGCPLVWGKCSHVFHLHCMMRWLETEGANNQCPMDRRPFEIQTQVRPARADGDGDGDGELAEELGDGTASGMPGVLPTTPSGRIAGHATTLTAANTTPVLATPATTGT